MPPPNKPHLLPEIVQSVSVELVTQSEAMVSAPTLPLALVSAWRKLSRELSLVSYTVNTAGATRSAKLCTFARLARCFRLKRAVFIKSCCGWTGDEVSPH